jgi:hypothetical protein
MTEPAGPSGPVTIAGDLRIGRIEVWPEGPDAACIHLEVVQPWLTADQAEEAARMLVAAVAEARRQR